MARLVSVLINDEAGKFVDALLSILGNAQEERGQCLPYVREVRVQWLSLDRRIRLKFCCEERLYFI